MGIIIRRDVSSNGTTESQAQAQTEAASDSSSPGALDSSAKTVAQTTDATLTETNTQPITPTETAVIAPTTDNTTPSPEPTTADQQQPVASENKQTETDAYTTPAPTQDDTQNSNEYETTSSVETLNSALLGQATLAITSSTLPTSISIPISSSMSTVIQSASAIPSCSSSDAATASNSVCTSISSNDSQLPGGAIAGIVVGALAALAIVCGCLLFKRRRRNVRTEPPPRQSFLFTDEKPVLQSEPGSYVHSNISDYQSENTFGAHPDSQTNIPKYESPAVTITSEMNDLSKGPVVATALYPPIKRNRSNEYMQTNNRVSVAADTDNYTQSAMKLFEPPSRAMSPATGRGSQLSNNSSQTKRSIYRPSLHQSQLMPESSSDVDHLKRESTIDPYNIKKPMSLWDDRLQSEDDFDRSFNADFEWTHDNGYIQPPLYRP